MTAPDDTAAALAALNQVVTSAAIVPHPAANDAPPAPDAAPDVPGGEPPDLKAVNGFGLPQGCPVRPLGKLGKTCYYLDALDQLVALPARDHSRNLLVNLFAPHSHLLERFWPRKTKVREQGEDGETREAWKVSGFKADGAANDLMDACGRLGVWDPQNKVRGPGCWRDQSGGLIYHAGDVLWSRDGETETGVVDGLVYPTYPALPRPIDVVQPSAAEGGPGQVLFELLCTWHWQRSSHGVDPMLLVGWIGAAMLGGALEWRPMAFVTGDTQTGKSTLHRLLKYLFDGAAVETAETTAAGIYSHVRQSSLPILIDEAEATDDNRKIKAVIALARLAASGAVLLRGSAEHRGVEFVARSCFLFSAILMPPLGAADRNRMAILRLNELPRGQVAPVLDPMFWRDIGQRIRRRLFDQWPRFDATLERYKMALARVGHSNRAQDQFATLLACADLVMQDEEPDTDSLDDWARWLAPDKLQEVSDSKSNAEQCLDYLCQSQPEAYRGGTRQSVAELVAVVIDAHASDPDYAQQCLGSGGLAVISKRQPRKHYLAVPDSHRLLAQLYQGSIWGGEPGAIGGWSEALRRLESARAAETARIAGRVYRCTLIPVSMIVDQVERAEAPQPAGDEIPV